MEVFYFLNSKQSISLSLLTRTKGKDKSMEGKNLPPKHRNLISKHFSLENQWGEQNGYFINLQVKVMFTYIRKVVEEREGAGEMG